MNSHPWQQASVTASAEIRARHSCGSVSVPQNQSSCYDKSAHVNVYVGAQLQACVTLA